ncbi:MAG: porin family protein [Bacteroidetes bacterium]|nr:porin family protein [Bacteroidota bacterium]
MKKILLVFAIAILTTQLSYGQFALGVKIGYNASKLSTNVDTIKSQVNSGFHVGIWTHIGKRLYFAPELLYTMSGSIFTNEGNLSTNNWKTKVTVGSMDVPLMLGFKIIHSSVITWRIEVGPEMSFVVNTKVKEMNEGKTSGITGSNVNSTNWYVLGGTGIDVLFLTFDIRYQYGLNQFVKDVQNSSLKSTNSLFLVSVGFRIFGDK